MKVKSFEFNLFGVNTYIIWDEVTREAAVIDPAMSDEREIAVFDDYVRVNSLKMILMLSTHLHIDHTFGIDYIKSAYGLNVNASGADAFFGRGRSAQARMFRLRIPDPAPLEIDSEISDGQRFEVGSGYLEAIETPGHSPGSVSFYCPQAKCVFTGDTLFNGGIGRTDLAGGDYGLIIRSIKSRLLTLPADTVVYPGHGPASTVGKEMRDNPYL